MAKRLAIHVLDNDHGRRARFASAITALGHHAEIYESAQEFEDRAPEGGVVVALEDAIYEGISGLMGLLHREGRWLAVIATSASPSIPKAVEAIKQGALDYLPLPVDPARLAAAIEGVAAEAEAMSKSRGLRVAARARLERLSGREREVIERMSEGLTNKEIGRDLGISPRTVEIHRTNALSKLGARHSAEAVRMRFEAG